MKQSNSDPLPFVQVDRSVKPRASLLADVMGVSKQHALGSLVEWWDLCGDPRDLERIVEATPEGEEPEVVLTGDVVVRRFRLASTKDVDPATLADVGLLDPRPDGKFRVRGMSRYFAPIEKRMRSRAAAIAGGKARAGAPRAGGRFVSVAGGLAGVPAGDAPPDNQPTNQPATSRPPADAPAAGQPRTSPEPPLSVIGHRTETDRGSMPSPLLAHRVKPSEVKNSLGILFDSTDAARDFISWAKTQHDALAEPGPGAYDWARNFFEKFQPTDVELIRVAFARFLVWAQNAGKAPGWGLWLSERVWEPRWAEVRAEASARLEKHTSR